MKINCETISFEQQLGAEEDHILIWDLNFTRDISHGNLFLQYRHYFLFMFLVLFIYIKHIYHIYHISNSVLQTVMTESQSLNLAALYLVFLLLPSCVSQALCVSLVLVYLVLSSRMQFASPVIDSCSASETCKEAVKFFLNCC